MTAMRTADPNAADPVPGRDDGGRAAGWFYRYEGPTWLLAVGIYAAWGGLV